MEAKEIDIVPLDKLNIKDAYKLYNSGLNGSLTFLQFELKYNNGAFGIPECSHLAYFNNKAIGFYGIIPAMVVKDDKKFLAAQACEFITLKEFRKQKVHYQLGKKCYERLIEHDCKFVFGFHSKASFNASKKLAWKTVNKNLFRFHLPLNNYPLMNIVHKLKSKRRKESLFKKLINHQNIAENKIENILSKESGVSIIYDKTYISYKTFSPNYIVEFNNVKFWLKLRGYLEIGAIYYDDTADLQEAINELVSVMRKLPIKEIIITAPYNTQLYHALALKYSPLPSFVIGYLDFAIDYSGVDFLCNSADLDTF